MKGKIIVPDTKILCHTAQMDITDAREQYKSLYEYYTETKKVLITKKKEFSDKYDIAIKIADYLDEILEAPKEEREEVLSRVRGYQVTENYKMNDIFSSISIVKDKNYISLQFSIQKIDDKTTNPTLCRSEQTKVERFEKIYVKSLLSNLIISFESYLEKVLGVIIRFHPEKYLSNKDIKISDLLTNDVIKILDKEIESEISSLLYDSIKTIKLINDKDNINIDRYQTIFKEFSELYYRRNLFVHNDGIVNEEYLKKVELKFRKGKKLYDSIVCDDYYLDNAFTLLVKIETALYYELIGLLKNDKREMYNVLGNIGYDYLSEEKYAEAEYVYYLLCKPKGLPMFNKMMYQINHLNALKQQGKITKDSNEISSLDVSSCEDLFKLGKACLEEKNDLAYQLITKMFKNDSGKVTVKELKEWPLFVDFRKTEYYSRLQEDFTSLFNDTVFENKETVE